MALEHFFKMKEKKIKDLDYRIQEFYTDIEYRPEIKKQEFSFIQKILSWGLGI